LSSHEQILGNSTSLSDFVVVDGWAGNLDRTGNSDEVDDSDRTGNFDRIEGLGKGGDLGEADDLNGAVENLSGERNGVMSDGSLDAWEFH
jgi:hypothetical protein